MSGFYAVAVGRSAGIFNTWDECKGMVSGYPGAIYKKCKSREEAEQFIASAAGANTTTNGGISAQQRRNQQRGPLTNMYSAYQFRGPTSPYDDTSPKTSTTTTPPISYRDSTTGLSPNFRESVLPTSVYNNLGNTNTNNNQSTTNTTLTQQNTAPLPPVKQTQQDNPAESQTPLKETIQQPSDTQPKQEHVQQQQVDTISQTSTFAPPQHPTITEPIIEPPLTTPPQQSTSDTTSVPPEPAVVPKKRGRPKKVVDAVESTTPSTTAALDLNTFQTSTIDAHLASTLGTLPGEVLSLTQALEQDQPIDEGEKKKVKRTRKTRAQQLLELEQQQQQQHQTQQKDSQDTDITAVLVETPPKKKRTTKKTAATDITTDASTLTSTDVIDPPPVKAKKAAKPPKAPKVPKLPKITTKVAIHNISSQHQYHALLRQYRAQGNAIIIHSDGGSRPNPGACGSGVTIEFPLDDITFLDPTQPQQKNDKVQFYETHHLSIAYGHGTNNWGELGGLYHAYQYLEKVHKEYNGIIDDNNNNDNNNDKNNNNNDFYKPTINITNKNIYIFSDSVWALNICTQNWQLKNEVYLQPQQQPFIPKYRDVIFDKFFQNYQILHHNFFWVKGHEGFEGNEVVDGLALRGIEHSAGVLPHGKFFPQGVVLKQDVVLDYVWKNHCENVAIVDQVYNQNNNNSNNENNNNNNNLNNRKKSLLSSSSSNNNNKKKNNTPMMMMSMQKRAMTTMLAHNNHHQQHYKKVTSKKQQPLAHKKQAQQHQHKPGLLHKLHG